MAFIIKDRVKEGTTSTGTGAITLGGAAATFDPFNSYMTNGDTTYYAIVHTSTGVDEWEVGLGTWNTGNTLTRTTVLAGSNGTSAVNFSAGNKDVFMTYPAAHAALAGDDVNFANITVTGTVDGRDVAADGTKLDTVETNADVTDAVNVAAAGALMKSGGTMTGNLILNADPTAALGAATKEYVDTIASAGIHYHDPVRVETPSALTASYNNGSSGVGATLTNSGTQAALVIDGVTMALNDRVLVYNQTDETHNGIYTVTNVGSASTNWVMTRATDADSYGASDPDSFGKGDAFFVKEGNTGAGELYVMTTAGTITFGTTAIHFSQVAETAVYNAGTGITLTGTTFSIGQDVATSANVTFNQVTADIIGNVTGNITGDVTGNADTATALETARTIQLSGDVTGSASFDGSANINITAAVQDDSHAHVISNVDGLQAALDGKTTTSRTITAGNGLTGGGNLTANRTLNVGAGTGVTVNADDIAIGQDVGTTANVTFNQVTADNLRIGDWTGGDTYAAVSHSSQTGSEYMIINNDGHTYISASTGSYVYIRGGNNVSTYEVGVYPDAYATAAGSTIITEAGSGLSKSSRTLSHADTSSQASVNNSNGTVIQDITLDGYGHITGINSFNLDGRYYTETEADSRFVNVTGDSMTGPLSITGNSSYVGSYGYSTLVLQDTSGYPGIDFRYSDKDWLQRMEAGGSMQWAYRSGGNHTERMELTTGGLLYLNTNQRVFADNYHPNADKWTTARTLSLSGDASGSVSWDGSANATLSVTVANDSHTHDGRYYTETEADNRFVQKGVGYFWTNTGGNALSFQSADSLEASSDGASLEVFQDTSGADAFMQFHVGGDYAVNFGLKGDINDIAVGGWSMGNAWYRIWHQGNDGSGSGLDADLLDGVQGSSFLRSDVKDTGVGIDLNGGTLNQDSDATLYVTAGNNNDWGIKIGATSGKTEYGQVIEMPNSFNYAFRVTKNGAEHFNINSTGATIAGNYIWHAGNDGSGSGLDADLLDGIHASSFLRSDADDQIDGRILMSSSSSLRYYTNANGGYIPKPKGGHYVSSNGTTTGAIKIRLPVHGSNDMISFHVDVFDYTTNESFTMFIAGYVYQTTGNNTWVNETVVTTASNRSQDYTVRFGGDGSRNCLWIGETNSTWSYPQVLVRDLQVGYTSNINSWDDDWSISFVTAFDTVDQSHTDNLPAASDADTLDGLTSSEFLRSGTTDTMNGRLEMANILDMNNNDIYGVDQIFHHGDTNTYIQFHASDQFRVVTGGSERLEVNNSRTQIDTLLVTGTATFQGSVSGVDASARNGLFWENDRTIGTSHTITGSQNAMTAGPILIQSGGTVNIGDGEAWTVV